MNLIFLQVIQEPVHGILDGRKSIMCSMNVVGVILLTVAICTVQAGNNNSDYTIRYLLSLKYILNHFVLYDIVVLYYTSHQSHCSDFYFVRFDN